MHRHEQKSVQEQHKLEYWASGQKADENYRAHKHSAEASISLARHLCAMRNVWFTVDVFRQKKNVQTTKKRSFHEYKPSIILTQRLNAVSGINEPEQNRKMSNRVHVLLT